MTYKRRSLLGIAAASGLASCAVGPSYHVPKADAPHQFVAATGAASSTTVARDTASAMDLSQWWQSLGDAELDSLIERAIRANPDLQIALTRLQEVRTEEAVLIGDVLPQGGATGAAGRGTGSDESRLGAAAPLRAGDNKGSLPQIRQVAGFSAIWEIDLFGGYRRAIQAGSFDVQSALAARNAVLVSIVADVARNYVDLRGMQMRFEILRDNVATAQQSRDFQQVRFDRGLSNELDLQLAIREFETLQAQLPLLQSQIDATEYNIAVLLGLYPEQLTSELAASGTLPEVPAAVAAGMPLDVLERRPDVRAAERALGAASARIGVATADLFPHIALTGALGSQSADIGAHGGHIWSLGPAVYWPLLDFGALDAQVSVADLQAHERLLVYRKTVIGAVQDADTAISNYSAQQQRLESLAAAMSASERAVNLAQQRYDRGLTDFLNVVDAERQQYSLEDQYIAARQSAAEAFIYLCRALGGGWEQYQTLPSIRLPLPAAVAGFRRLLTNNDPQK